MDIFWKTKGWERGDRDLVKMRNMPFQRPIPFIPEKMGLYIIRGPRQIGKTSWLKMVLSHYASSTECAYLSCENLRDNTDLAEFLKSVRHCRVILLDEVNFVEGWDRAVKHEVDRGLHHIIMVTGSHAHDLKQGADRMPGRFDGGGEFNLLPMDFHEFCEMRKQAGWKKLDRIDEILRYFEIGGFPTALAESNDGNSIPQKTIKTYFRWLSGDFVKLGKQEIFLKQLLIQLALTLQSPISLNTLAKKTGIGSHNTIQEYISILESCFALRTLYSIDADSGAYRFKKDKKFYFTDPLLYWVAVSLSGKKKDEDWAQKVSELTAAETLMRKYDRIGYYNSSKGGEVDFLIPSALALEVKWSPSAENLSAAYKNLRIPNKIIWTQNNFFMDILK